MPPRRLLVWLWAVVWFAYGLSVLRSGVLTGVDTGLYSLWADGLIAHRFNIATFLQSQNFYIPPFLYTGWIVLVATLKSLFGGSWTTAVVVLNWLAVGAGLYAALSSIRRTTASAASLLLAFALFLAAGDLLIFMPFALSDLIFWGMATVVLVTGVALATKERDHGHAMTTVLAGTVLVLFAMVFRPGGLTLVLFWSMAVVSWLGRDRFDRFAIPLFAAAAAIALLAIAWHAAIMVDPAVSPISGLSGYFDVLSRDYHAGVLVDAPESDLMVGPAVTWPGAMRLTTQKAFYFMTPWLPHYSRMHTLINLAFFIPAYGLTIAAAMNRNRLSATQRRAVLLLLFFVANELFSHVLIQLDYDHRYRLPMLPALVMLAAIGLESIRRPPLQHAVNTPRRLV